jgi:hypothetical protein
MKKNIRRFLPLLGFTLLASCSDAIMLVGRDPRKLVGKSRVEILGEFGKPIRSTKRPDGGGKIHDETFKVKGAWRKESRDVNWINHLTLGLTELVFVPAAIGFKARETVAGCELIVQYRPDARQTVEDAIVPFH